MRRPWINSLWVLALTGLGAQPAFAVNCPQAEVAADKAIKEGVGAQWDENQVKWYLDYFSAGKPDEASLKKFTFLQALYEKNLLTCYYGWGNDTWMTVRLKTTQTVAPKWQGDVCQNFMAENCQFDLSGPVAPEPTTPTTTPGTTTPGTTPTTPTTPSATPAPDASTTPAAPATPNGTTTTPSTPPASGTTPPTGNVTPPAGKTDESKPLEAPKL